MSFHLLLDTSAVPHKENQKVFYCEQVLKALFENANGWTHSGEQYSMYGLDDAHAATAETVVKAFFRPFEDLPISETHEIDVVHAKITSGSYLHRMRPCVKIGDDALIITVK